MANKGRTEKCFFGGYDHYDEKGKKIGHSEPSFLGGYDHYDDKGHKTGHTDPAFLGGYNHYDEKGNKTGHSDPNFFGGYSNYDKNGKKISESNPGFTGGYKHSDGCFIATCVYGGYDLPEVITLRRFRDCYLRNHFTGRIFIQTYYAVSPHLVKRFGKKDWFRNGWKLFLDRFVKRLQVRGY